MKVIHDFHYKLVMIFGLWKSVFVLHSVKNLLTLLLCVSSISLACIDTILSLKAGGKNLSDGSTIKLKDQIMFVFQTRKRREGPNEQNQF
jgi:hypothetical protein